MRHKKATHSHAQAGFTLVEVLISIVILAFGVISMGGLQLASIKATQISRSSAVASKLANDYVEMMRSNPSVALAASSTYFIDTDSISAAPGECSSAACSPADVATLHTREWAARVKGTLPQGRAVVCADQTPKASTSTGFEWACDSTGSMVVIKVGWVDKRSDAERGTTTFTVSAPQFAMVTMPGYAE